MGSEAMTYHEKKLLGYGTAHERLSKESIGNFDDCRITLQPAIDPVCTPEGVVYSREAIIEYLVHQKKDIKRKLEAWEELQAREQQEAAEKAAMEEQARVAEFERLNALGASSDKAREAGRQLLEEAQRAKAEAKVLVAGGINIQSNKERLKQVKAFWGANVVPEAGPTPSAVLVRGRPPKLHLAPVPDPTSSSFCRTSPRTTPPAQSPARSCVSRIWCPSSSQRCRQRMPRAAQSTWTPLPRTSSPIGPGLSCCAQPGMCCCTRRSRSWWSRMARTGATSERSGAGKRLDHCRDYPDRCPSLGLPVGSMHRMSSSCSGEGQGSPLTTGMPSRPAGRHWSALARA